MRKFFEASDLEMTTQDIYPLSKKDQKIAELPIIEEAEDTVRVGSQSSVTEWHTVLHFDGTPIKCDCLYSQHHPCQHEIIPGEDPIEGNQCKAHFRRLEMAVEKRRIRLAEKTQPPASTHREEAASTDKVTVDVKVEVNVSEQASQKRVEAPLHVKPFSLLGN